MFLINFVNNNIYPKEEPSKDLMDAQEKLKQIMDHNPTKLQRKQATNGKKANSFVVGNIKDRFFKSNNKAELGPVMWNKKNPDFIESLTPIYEDISDSFQAVMPTEARHKEDVIPTEMRLRGTKQFTSSVINYDLQCATHKDADDFAFGERKEPQAGYCIVKVYKDVGSSGGYLLFPEFMIGFDIRNSGFAIFQAWKYIHANSKIENEATSHRISIVAYANKKVINCYKKRENASKKIKPS